MWKTKLDTWINNFYALTTSVPVKVQYFLKSKQHWPIHYEWVCMYHRVRSTVYGNGNLDYHFQCVVYGTSNGNAYMCSRACMGVGSKFYVVLCMGMAMVWPALLKEILITIFSV